MATIETPDTRTDEEKGIFARSTREGSVLGMREELDEASSQYSEFSLAAEGAREWAREATLARKRELEAFVQDGGTRTASGGVITTPASVAPRLTTPLATARPPVPSTSPSTEGAGGEAPVAEVTPAVVAGADARGRDASMRVERMSPTAPKTGAARQDFMKFKAAAGSQDTSTFDENSALSKASRAAAGEKGVELKPYEIDAAIRQLESLDLSRAPVNVSKPVGEMLVRFKRMRNDIRAAGASLVGQVSESLDLLTATPQEYNRAVIEQANLLPPAQRAGAIKAALDNMPPEIRQRVQMARETELAGMKADEAQRAAREAQQRAMAEGNQITFEQNYAWFTNPETGLALQRNIPKDYETFSTDPKYAEDFANYTKAIVAGQAPMQTDNQGNTIPAEPPKTAGTSGRPSEQERLRQAQWTVAGQTISGAGVSQLVARNLDELSEVSDEMPTEDSVALVEVPPAAAAAASISRHKTDENTYADAARDAARGMLNAPDSAYVGVTVDALAQVLLTSGKKRLFEQQSALAAQQQQALAVTQAAELGQAYGSQDNRSDAVGAEADTLYTQIIGGGTDLQTSDGTLDPGKLRRSAEASVDQLLALKFGDRPRILDDNYRTVRGQLVSAFMSEVSGKYTTYMESRIQEIEKDRAKFPNVDPATAVEIASNKTKAGEYALRKQDVALLNMIADAPDSDSIKAEIQQADATYMSDGYYSDVEAAAKRARIYNFDTPSALKDRPDDLALYRATPKVHEGTGLVNLRYLMYHEDNDTIAAYIAMDDPTKATLDDYGNLQLPTTPDGQIDTNQEVLTNINLIQRALNDTLDNDGKPITWQKLVTMDEAERLVIVKRLWGTKGKVAEREYALSEFMRAAIHNGDDVSKDMMDSSDRATRSRGVLKAVADYTVRIDEGIRQATSEANSILAALPGMDVTRAIVGAQDLGQSIAGALAVGKASLGVDQGRVDQIAEALADAHSAFREMADPGATMFRSVGDERKDLRAIDQAFADARRRLGDASAYAGFGAEGAADEFIAQLDSNSPLAAAFQRRGGWSSTSGYTVATVAAGTADVTVDTRDIYDAKRTADAARIRVGKEILSTVRRDKVGVFEVRGTVEQQIETLREMVRDIEIERDVPLKDVDAMLDRKLNAAAAEVYAPLRERLVSGMSRRLASQARDKARGVAADTEIDRLYNDTMEQQDADKL